jgi:hypothetical protein
MTTRRPGKGAARETDCEITEKRLRPVSDAPLPSFTISRFTRVNYGAIVATFSVSIEHVDLAFALTIPEGKPAFASPAKIKCCFAKSYRASAFISDDFAAAILSRALARYESNGEDDQR